MAVETCVQVWRVFEDAQVDLLHVTRFTSALSFIRLSLTISIVILLDFKTKANSYFVRNVFPYWKCLSCFKVQANE